MKRLTALPLLLGLAQGAEAKPLPEVKTPEHHTVHDVRNIYGDLCSDAIRKGEETAPLKECITRRLEQTKFQPSTPMMDDIGGKYEDDPRLEPLSDDLVKEQSRVTSETLQKLKSHLGKKVTFISEPVMVFGSYRPAVLPEDIDGNREIEGEREEGHPEEKAPYRRMIAYIALNESLTPEEEALLHEETCNAEGWCLRVARTMGIWSGLAEGGRFAGFTGDLKLLEEKAPWGIVVQFEKQEL